MKGLELKCPLYFTSNAGQLLTGETAMKYPIQIFSSGATNSIVGASFLSQTAKPNTSRYVVDIGGTTTEVGCLLPSGFPRLASAFTEIGGVRVNFTMPQVESIGLGGGSLVQSSHDGALRIGPESVGQNLSTKALCFGGENMTATDILVASGDTVIGKQQPNLERDTITAAKARIKCMLEDCIDRMKTTPEPCHVLVVGGGSFLCPDEVDGVAEIERPIHADVANAIGAAIAEVGATKEAIVDSSVKQDALNLVREHAIAQAISSGAKKDAIRIIEESVSGLAYIEAKCKILVKVAGPIDHDRPVDFAATEQITESQDDGLDLPSVQDENTQEGRFSPKTLQISPSQYRPHIGNDRIWHLSETDLLYISIGCYILGCGGGGSPYSKYLETRELLRSGHEITIADVTKIPENGHCPPVAGIGSPAVGVERLGGDMVLHALKTMEKYLGISYSAMLSVEIGGGNGMESLYWGSSKHYNLPTVDGDLMGIN